MQNTLTFKLILSLPALLLMTTACKTISHRVEINAPAEEVMNELRRTADYPEWNTFMRIEGDLKVDRQIAVKIRPAGDNWWNFTPTVLENSPNELAWRGRLLMPGLADGVHRFRIVQAGDKKVVFEQHEDFSGILVPFYDTEPARQGFENMNEALKKRVEDAQGRTQ